MALDDFEVDASITSMKAQGLLRIVHPSHGRSVTRYRQVAVEKFELDEAAARRSCRAAGPWSTDSRRASLANRAAARASSQPPRSKPACTQLADERAGQAARPPSRAEGAAVAAADRRGGRARRRRRQPSFPQRSAGSMADRVAQLEERVAKLESALADLL